MFKITSFTSTKKLHIFAVTLLLVKLCLLFFTQTIDADAVTRSQLGSQLLTNPKWITEGVWPPLHIYLTSFSLWIYNDIIYSPRIMNILLSVFTLYPIFYFLQREFNSKKALVGVLIFALSPVIIHISLMNLSETSFFLFVAMGLNYLSNALKKDQLRHFILAGLAFTLAAAIRMEAWPLIALLALALLLNKKLIPSIIFSLSALVFPLFWMYGNYIAHADPLFSIRAINVLESPDWEGFLRKIWFFPFMLFIAIGPIFMFSILKGIKQWKKQLLSPWIFTPIVLFGIILYKSITGTMIAHPRFIGLITLLCLPLILQESVWINKVLNQRKYIIGSLILTIGLSFVYNIKNVTPLPIIKNKEMLSFSKLLTSQLEPEQTVFIDFLNWEDTYYLSLQLHSCSKNQTIIDGYIPEEESFQLFDAVYDNTQKQLWVLKPEHRHWIAENPNFEIIRSSENVIIAVSSTD